MNRTCFRCKQNKDITLFSKDKNRKDGRAYLCKECIAKRDLVREKTRIRLNKRDYKSYYKKYSSNPLNKHKIEARRITHQAIKNGTLVKKDYCEVCFSKEGIEGHHTDYSKPLEIQWLCKVHHWQADQLLRNKQKSQ